jgi:hypothetical protein
MAQFGRGLVQDVSNQMFQKFTEAVRAELERPDEPAAPAPAGAPITAASTETSGAPAGATGSIAPSMPGTAPVAAPPSPGPTPAPPIEVFSFGGKILMRATGRMMRKPLFWVAVAAGAGLIYRLFVR